MLKVSDIHAYTHSGVYVHDAPGKHLVRIEHMCQIVVIPSKRPMPMPYQRSSVSSLCCAMLRGWLGKTLEING